MKLKVFSGTLASETAGLSPNNNERIELFLSGCKMAASGHPCPGCFNKALWHEEDCTEYTPQEIADYMLQTDEKYLTIVGGEPLDQSAPLTELCKILYQHDFHICLITHYLLDEVKKNHADILKYLSMIIDGKYNQSERIFDTDMRPGVLHVVGSRNQRIYWRDDDKRWRDVTNETDLVHYYATKSR